MDESADPGEIAILISMGISLLSGCFSVLVAIRSGKGAAVQRDTTVSILFGTAFLVTCLDLVAVALIAVWGMAYVGTLKAALLLTAAFAVVGLVCGLTRGLRSGRATKAQSA